MNFFLLFHFDYLSLYCDITLKIHLSIGCFYFVCFEYFKDVVESTSIARGMGLEALFIKRGFLFLMDFYTFLYYEKGLMLSEIMNFICYGATGIWHL